MNSFEQLVRDYLRLSTSDTEQWSQLLDEDIVVELVYGPSAGLPARIEGRDLDAMRLYDRAIAAARSNGFVHNEAVANEVAAQFYAAFPLVFVHTLEREHSTTAGAR